MAITNKKTGSVLHIEGLDISKPAEYISDQACSSCQNVEVFEGLLSKRSGETRLGSVIGGTDIEIMGGRTFSREGVFYNVRIGLDKIESYNTSSGAWEDITGTDLTFTNADIVSTAIPMLSGQPILCIANGIDAIRKWTGTGNTAALGGTPPVAKFIQEYKTYLVCANIAGGTDIPQRVQWSDTADPEDWSSGNAGSQDLVEDGGEITGINLYGNYLCIHKDTSIYLGYLVSSTDIFKFDRKSTGVGTLAHNSIVNLPTGEQIFLAKDGLRLFNGITAPVIEAPVNDEIRREMNKDHIHRAYGVLVKEKDEVWMGIPIGALEVGDIIYKFNYKTRVLYKDYRPNATIMWLGSATNSVSWDDVDITWDNFSYRWNDISFSADDDQINIGYTDGQVNRTDVLVNEDNGSAIQAFWDSKDFQDSQDRISRWKKIEIWATGVSITVKYSIDEGQTWTEVTGSPFTLSSSMPTHESPLIGYLDVVSSKIRIRIENTGSNNFQLKQFILEYSPREYR